MRKHIFDAWIMFKRCFLISLRNPEALLMATITPFFLTLLFGTVFGSIADVGNLNYIDFIVPGIIMQSFGTASQHTAMNVSSDMAKGITDRFRSMSISKSAVLIGHTGAGVVRNVISAAVIIATAFLLGFRPQGGFTSWLLIAGVLVLVSITISLLAVLCGIISKTPEGSSGLMFPLFILPFISSGFVPTEAMPSGIKIFAEVQPMTPMIDSVRALMLDLPLGNSLWIALIWCLGLSLVSFLAAIQVYTHKSAQ